MIGCLIKVCMYLKLLRYEVVLLRKGKKRLFFIVKKRSSIECNVLMFIYCIIYFDVI